MVLLSLLCSAMDSRIHRQSSRNSNDSLEKSQEEGESSSECPAEAQTKVDKEASEASRMILSYDIRTLNLSSKGISRGFVISFLERLLVYVQAIHASSERYTPIHFPFPDNVIQMLLDETIEDFKTSSALRRRAEENYCGNAFDPADKSTHWTRFVTVTAPPLY